MSKSHRADLQESEIKEFIWDLTESQQKVVGTGHLYICPMSALIHEQITEFFFRGKWKLIVLLSKYLNHLKLPRYFNSSEIFQQLRRLLLTYFYTVFTYDMRSLSTKV